MIFSDNEVTNLMRPEFNRPYAITMWDFSWLERRWPGAGYEDWDQALAELTHRGYDAVRIDAYPHLISADPERKWELLPAWDQADWGAKSVLWTTVLPQLLDFLRAAKRAGVAVALSSWFREDRDNTRVRIRNAQDHGQVWADTLQHISEAGLLDTILYVDLCNEFPMLDWAPFYYSDQILADVVRGEMHRIPVIGSAKTPLRASLTTPRIKKWMADAVSVVRSAFPNIDYTFSFAAEMSEWREQDVSSLDIMEPHIWMANAFPEDYYGAIGYEWERFSPVGFDNIVARGRREYEQHKERYDAALIRDIDIAADWSRATGRGLYTTECWAVVDYKDWPGLEWDWVQELNALAVRYVVEKGRWVGIATSNFCGPQFVGMWREVDWHRELTTLIKGAPIDPDIRARRIGSSNPDGAGLA